MDTVFKFVKTLFNYGQSIQIYENIHEFMNAISNYGCSIQIYGYTIQLWVEYSIYEYTIQLFIEHSFINTLFN